MRAASFEASKLHCKHYDIRAKTKKTGKKIKKNKLIRRKYTSMLMHVCVS